MEIAPLIVTLKTAVAATFITFFAGIFLAYKVANLEKFKGLADAIITLPMVLPPTVVGFFLFYFSASAVLSENFYCSLIYLWYFRGKRR